MKPANIVLSSTGPRLIDFGIAQQVGDTGGPTGPGLVVGSPGWIPPERLDHRPATPASDVFGSAPLNDAAAQGSNPPRRRTLRRPAARRSATQPPQADAPDRRGNDGQGGNQGRGKGGSNGKDNSGPGSG